MMHEHDAGFLIGGAVLLAVIDQNIAEVHVEMLVASHAGDDRNAGEVLGGPSDLLRRRPVSQRQAGA